MFKQTLRQHLEKYFPNNELSRWFDPLEMNVDEESRIVRVGFPHTYFGRWFMQTVQQEFEQRTTGFSDSMSFIYENAPVTSLVMPKKTFQAARSEVVNKECDDKHSHASSAHIFENIDTPLFPEHTFDNFLVNKKNDFPLAAAKECVAKASRPPYIPFVIYGQSGAGKTHLLSAMADAIRSLGLPMSFGSMSFLERMTLSPGISAPIDELYVFLDDVQRVSEWPNLQDALVTLIDMFKASGRLLVLVFDTHPAASKGLGQKLQSRLAAGLVVEIKRPDLDIRRQYVQRRNSQQNLGLGREQILTVAQRYQDIRSIDGALTRLCAYRSLLRNHDSAISPPDMSSILDREPDHSFLSPSSIILTVARHFSVPPEELAGKNRDKAVSLARHIAILLCRELLGVSLVQAGRIFGGRDHSSVLYSIKKIKQLQDSNKDMHKRVEELRKLCLTRH